jgi:hypothetical protein
MGRSLGESGGFNGNMATLLRFTLFDQRVKLVAISLPSRCHLEAWQQFLIYIQLVSMVLEGWQQ